MKVKELIEALQRFDGDITVDCNNTHGIYSSVRGVMRQEWKDREGCYHRVVTILHDGYDADESIIRKDVVEIGEPVRP